MAPRVSGVRMVHLESPYLSATELQHDERLELIECRAIAALRAQRGERARALYGEALELACESQNLMSGRVLRNYGRRFGADA